MSMGLWGKLGGAGLGLAIGGPLGGLVGGVAGHFLVDRVGALFGTTPRDVVFTTGLVALAAKMAKSDGVVTPAEVEAFAKVVQVDERARPGVQRLFDLAKGTSNGFEAYARHCDWIQKHVFPGSLLAAAVGWAVGTAYRRELLPGAASWRVTGVAPVFSAKSCRVSGPRELATNTLWPSLVRRPARVPPMLPAPMIPMFIAEKS